MSPDQVEVETHLARTLDLARRSLARGNYPVGAVLVDHDGQTIGSGYNESVSSLSRILHAEMRAIGRARGRLDSVAPGTATLYTSGEPCLMCLGAVLLSPALGTVVWAAGPVSAAGSAIAAVRASGYNSQRLDLVRFVAEPSATARRESRRLLFRWCTERSDPRAPMFADGPGESPATESFEARTLR